MAAANVASAACAVVPKWCVWVPPAAGASPSSSTATDSTSPRHHAQPTVQVPALQLAANIRGEHCASPYTMGMGRPLASRLPGARGSWAFSAPAGVTGATQSGREPAARGAAAGGAGSAGAGSAACAPFGVCRSRSSAGRWPKAGASKRSGGEKRSSGGASRTFTQPRATSAPDTTPSKAVSAASAGAAPSPNSISTSAAGAASARSRLSKSSAVRSSS